MTLTEFNYLIHNFNIEQVKFDHIDLLLDFVK